MDKPKTNKPVEFQTIAQYRREVVSENRRTTARHAALFLRACVDDEKHHDADHVHQLWERRFDDNGTIYLSFPRGGRTALRVDIQRPFVFLTMRINQHLQSEEVVTSEFETCHLDDPEIELSAYVKLIAGPAPIAVPIPQIMPLEPSNTMSVSDLKNDLGKQLEEVGKLREELARELANLKSKPSKSNKQLLA